MALQESRLILPFGAKYCAKCGSDRIWQTLKGELECMNCYPPQEWLRDQQKKFKALQARERAREREIVNLDEQEFER